jgi:hypothetical protein
VDDGLGGRTCQPSRCRIARPGCRAGWMMRRASGQEPDPTTILRHHQIW